MTKIEYIRCKQIITGNPCQEPIDNGCIVHDGHVIHGVGTYSQFKNACSGEVTDLGSVTIVPGLVNAHCHLELSKLKGKTVSGEGFIPWLLSMMAHNYREIDFIAVEQAVIAARDQGVCCYGDIVTPQNGKIIDILTNLGIYHTCFFEAFGFLPAVSQAGIFPHGKTDLGAVAGAGHALHTTHPAMLKEIKRKDSKMGLPFSIHMAEHEDEIGMLMGEKNSFYKLLEQNNLLGQYVPPMKTPIEHGRDLGLLDSTTLAVHCVKVSDKDIETLANTATNVCLCPRSNEFIGVGRAPWEKFLDAGIRVCLGTDSIASNHDLNLWNELSYFLKRIEQSVSISEAISLITLNPARALLMDHKLGSLEKGKIFSYAVMPESIIKGEKL
ncbi:Cytosine/adenosine deaminase [Desulfocicer vacuolatum DSM 3385]|uniref:Cytosine/adenosine deaminase n=1 Tax=Desulfocicer vacuolatum DSM 3385 TaxID=1121400 RepID=A0A1W2BHV0_9BACT|nr:amidohydrolase family protein [Desulfocicer vacuolatum]SMC72484.1 Cytosine/adenosine deaminase [Desulfocicer vacuolatum DSM 3385]